MSQVVRTTNDVIINSLYLLGELAVGEVPDAFMLSTGLDLLNELLDKFSSDSIYIPYLTTINFTMVVGVDTYTVSDMMPAFINQDRIVDLSFANYFIPSASAFTQGQPVTFTYTADTVTNTLTFGDTSFFPTGTAIVLSTSGTMPSPLIAGVTYYAINLTPTTIRLASTLQNALMGTSITLLTNGIPINQITTFLNTNIPINTSLSYPIRILNKAQYYGVVRQVGLLARPGFVFLNKQATESFITFYPVPDQPYPCTLQVKCMINKLDNQDTLGELPPNYYGFLKYALARKFLGYYPSGNWTQTSEEEYQDYYMTFKNTNETDLTVRPSVTLTAPEPFYWPNILSY